MKHLQLSNLAEKSVIVLCFTIFLAGLCGCQRIQWSESSESLSHFMTLKENQDQRFTVVALGDSNTEVNWTSGGLLNWVGLLSAGIYESGCAKRYTLINSGVSGDGVGEGLARLERDVLAYDPDLVIICFGTNDVWRETTPEDFETALREMVSRIRSCGASLVLRTPTPDYDEEKKTLDIKPAILSFIEIIQRVAAEENITLVDHFNSWRNDPPDPVSDYYINELHPNGKGHLRLYHEIAPVLGLHERLKWE